MTPEMTEAIVLDAKIRDIQLKIQDRWVACRTGIIMMKMTVERLAELGEETKHIYQRNKGVLEMYERRMKG